MLKKLFSHGVVIGRRNATALSEAVESAKSDPKVVVIGGGLAGLSATDRLLCSGVSDVTLLEATDRLGGRVLSGWLGDTQVELGLETIGGASVTNPLFNMAVYDGNELVDQTSADGKEAYVSSGGRMVWNHTAQKLLFQKIVRDIPAKTKTPLIQYLHLRIQQALADCSEDWTDDWEPVLYGLANQLRMEQGGQVATLPAWTVKFRPEGHGRPVKIKSGNSCLLSKLIARIPVHKVRLQEEVRKVIWGEGVKGALVHTECGNCHPADYVISTLPAGVLLERADELFCPCLPEGRKSVLRSLNITATDVIHLEYGEPWWSDDGLSLRFGWSANQLLQEGNWLRGVYQIRSSSSTVLSVVMIGEETRMVEESTDEEVAAEITVLMRKLMGDPSIPYPRHVLMTRWGSNKFCRGSYLGLAGHSADPLADLGKPLPEHHDPVLLFAGDYSSPEAFGSAVAARNSGLREANRVLALAGRKQ